MQPQAAREKLIEAVATVDDDLMHKYLEGEEITEDEIRAALRKGTLELKLVPVVTGSAFKNKGVQTLLDAVVDYLPSPLDIPAVEGDQSQERSEIEQRPAGCERSVCRSGLQDHGRQASRPALLCAHLQRHHQIRLVRVQHGQGHERTRRAIDAHARQQA